MLEIQIEANRYLLPAEGGLGRGLSVCQWFCEQFEGMCLWKGSTIVKCHLHSFIFAATTCDRKENSVMSHPAMFAVMKMTFAAIAMWI